LLGNRSILGLLRGGIPALLFLGLFTLATFILARPVENFMRDVAMSSISPYEKEKGEIDDIVIVTITEDTLKAFPYRSPLDRAFLAEVIDKLSAAGPKVIGIDILFDQESEAEKDAALREAIETSVTERDVPVVIVTASAKDGLTQAQLEFLRNFAPHAERGLANLRRDPFDGVVRGRFVGQAAETEDGETQWRPGLAAAMALITGKGVPEGESPLIYYRQDGAQPYAFRSYPAHTVKVLPAEWFKDKYVFIGADLPIEDRHATPFIARNGVSEGRLPGVAIHAQALEQFLRGETLWNADPIALTLILAVFCAAAAWLCWLPLAILAKPLIVAGILGLYWVAAGVAFSRFSVALPVAAPSAIIAGVSFLTAFMAWKRDSDQRRFIESAFGKYVSPAVVQNIVRQPDSLKLGGEERVVTCVFTDLEGFTSFSEKLPPEQTAIILNDYLDRMCDIFVAHGATIDKVIGDAVVGFFGAPASQDNDAHMAVQLALAVDEFSEDYRAGQAKRGVELGITRVGIHRGKAIVGNFGGERFFDYTAIGDTVNTAARLEGANKYVSTRLCVSSAVALNATKCTFRPTGTIYLKGKQDGIDTFEPIDLARADAEWLREYGEAFELMRNCDANALQAFETLKCKYPDDRLIAFHHERLSNAQEGANIVLGEK